MELQMFSDLVDELVAKFNLAGAAPPRIIKPLSQENRIVHFDFSGLDQALRELAPAYSNHTLDLDRQIDEWVAATFPGVVTEGHGVETWLLNVTGLLSYKPITWTFEALGLKLGWADEDFQTPCVEQWSIAPLDDITRWVETRRAAIALLKDIWYSEELNFSVEEQVKNTDHSIYAHAEVGGISNTDKYPCAIIFHDCYYGKEKLVDDPRHQFGGGPNLYESWTASMNYRYSIDFICAGDVPTAEGQIGQANAASAITAGAASGSADWLVKGHARGRYRIWGYETNDGETKNTGVYSSAEWAYSRTRPAIDDPDKPGERVGGYSYAGQMPTVEVDVSEKNVCMDKLGVKAIPTNSLCKLGPLTINNGPCMIHGPEGYCQYYGADYVESASAGASHSKGIGTPPVHDMPITDQAEYEAWVRENWTTAISVMGYKKAFSS